MVSGIPSSLGLQSLLADTGVHVNILVGMDASPCLAMTSRRGFGRAKRIQVQYLWVQDLVVNKKGEIRKNR